MRCASGKNNRRLLLRLIRRSLRSQKRKSCNDLNSTIVRRLFCSCKISLRCPAHKLDCRTSALEYNPKVRKEGNMEISFVNKAVQYSIPEMLSSLTDTNTINGRTDVGTRLMTKTEFKPLRKRGLISNAGVPGLHRLL